MSCEKTSNNLEVKNGSQLVRKGRELAECVDTLRKSTRNSTSRHDILIGV